MAVATGHVAEAASVAQLVGRPRGEGGAAVAAAMAAAVAAAAAAGAQQQQQQMQHPRGAPRQQDLRLQELWLSGEHDEEFQM